MEEKQRDERRKHEEKHAGSYILYFDLAQSIWKYLSTSHFREAANQARREGTHATGRGGRQEEDPSTCLRKGDRDSGSL